MGFRTLLACGALLASATPLWAQGTITDGDVTFTRGASAFDTTPAADFKGVGGSLVQDHLFEYGWWFRLEGATQETAFGIPTTEAYVADESFLAWEGLGDGAFDAFETISVLDAGSVGDPSAGSAHAELQIVNQSAVAPLTLTIFHLADLDISNTGEGDAAALFEFDIFRSFKVQEGGTSIFYAADEQASAYLVRAFGVTSVRSLLNDTAVTQFDNTGLPFGPGDITAGFEFPITLPPNGSTILRVNLSSGFLEARCNSSIGVYCDGFEVGSTALWSAVAP